MKLYIADINGITLERAGELDFDRAQKAARYKKVKDKKRCIAGGLFFNKFLKGVQITKNEYGKPVAKDGDFFNLSHSGDYAIFVLSDCQVGCDIQYISFIKAEDIAKLVFCAAEMDLLSQSIDKTDTFYELWTKKESLLKCIGEGFHRSSKSINVANNIFSENGKEYYFKIWSFSDYKICVCSEKNDFPKEIEFVNL